MKKSILLLTICMCALTLTSQAQFGGILKKAQEKTSGSGFADSKSIQPDAAISNVERNLKTITDQYYASYKEKGISYLNNDGQLWFIRKVMEVARYYYSGGKMGYHGGGVVCDLGPAQADPRYLALAAKFSDAEAKVKEMEKAKGYEFVECTDNNIIFKEVSTGNVLSADDSSKI